MTQPFRKTDQNASGVKTMTRMSTSSVNNVTSVQLYRSFSPADSLFPVPVNVVVSSVQVIPSSSRPQGVPLSSMCLVVSTCQKKLFLPSRVTPIDAPKPLA